MDGEDNLPEPPAVTKSLFRPVVQETTTSSSSSSFSSSSPPEFLRQVQAAFKRHRPPGAMQSNSFRARRILLPQREAPSCSLSQPEVVEEAKKPQDALFDQGHVTNNLNTETKTTVVVRKPQEDATDTSPVLLGTMTGCTDKSKTTVVVRKTQEDATDTSPVLVGTMTGCSDKSCKPINAHKEGPKLLTSCQDDNLTLQHGVVSQLVDAPKKVQLSMDNGSIHQGKNSKSMINTEGEASSILLNHESKLHNFQKAQINKNLGSDSGISMMVKSKQTGPDQLHRLKSFLSEPVTQSSVAGLSCATTTSISSTSAPLHYATACCSYLQKDNNSHGALEAATFDLNRRPLAQGMVTLPSNASTNSSCSFVINESCTSSLVPDSSIKSQTKAKEDDISKEQESIVPKQTSILKGAPLPHDSNNVRPPQNLNIAVKVDASKTEKQEKATEKQEKATSSKGATIASKRNYDPDLFFKVNGKLYQRLGKIGSGGSSEVHKVISSDCTIYALKKIKLKGRDYATAYGFCQEIVYLSKLKGKNNIIQLVDYEVTDKMLLREVMNGFMSNKEARVKDDGCIFMVLEYGEIDLANMLSQKWKEMDGFNQTIDENWLRFYWQQILQAVNTIHEERIVHSDLKPANFLLVKGSLKLIDFGIAKAIMSDTTNIQRESQVGTLSYMSPEAFMCNESDSSGNAIKCGRPSDIWSLGCILYQMVYGKTPFSEYKTFWAKFKVITDPNHRIIYGRLSNPRLLDLLKKCLAWDRNDRWRIPQLLQHPFLVPPVPPQLALSQAQSSTLLQLIAETCADDPQASSLLLSQLQQLLTDPASRPMTSILITSTEDQCDLFPEISNTCLRLRQQSADSKR